MQITVSFEPEKFHRTSVDYGLLCSRRRSERKFDRSIGRSLTRMPNRWFSCASRCLHGRESFARTIELELELERDHHRTQNDD